MAKQQIGLGPPIVGTSVPIVSADQQAPVAITITDMERHSVVQTANGGKVYLYRHDLCKPTIKLVKQSFEPAADKDAADKGEGPYTYTYEISNDKTALEAINQVYFVLIDGPALIWYTPEGVAPGATQMFSVTSKHPPGMRKVNIVNIDDIKESAYLAQFPEPDAETVDAYHAGSMSLRADQPDPTEHDVVGPVVPADAR